MAIQENPPLKKNNGRRLSSDFHFSILFCLLAISPLFIFQCRSSKDDTETMKKAKSRLFQCQWETRPKPIIVREGEIITLNLKLTNAGRRPWKSIASPPCLLSYHLLDEKKKMLRRDNPRFALPGEVKPGDKIEVKINFPAPLNFGRYFLEFDLVLEGRAWFKEYGSPTLLLPLEVKPLPLPEFSQRPGLEVSPYTLIETTWSEINNLSKLIRLTLFHGETRFRGLTGEVAGFRAGTGYPQIWVRDSATILLASRYFYSDPFLASWLEEILSHQDERGSIPDWVDASGQTDKNTTESDQEASAIQAASLFVKLLGKERGSKWLEKKIGGQRIIDRLEQGLIYLFNHRYDQNLKLIIGAHTADWGDIEINESDQQAIYADDQSIWTADIYDQSMAYQACLDLSFLFSLVENKKKSFLWRRKAQEIKEKTNEFLWQPERGFYRVHQHITPLNHDLDEDNLFALGGNALAILSGLADEEKAKRIIQVTLDRQQKYKISTISGCLLPPYPAGFFQHPLMDDPYEYQNGGQWDWFGGRMIAAMYRHGFSEQATRCLLEIARKNVERGTFYEWDTKEGIGQGSLNFAGSAGALALALYEGLLGFEVNEERPVLSPRLGWASAQVQIYFPLNGFFYAYKYIGDEASAKINLALHSNDPRPGLVRLLWPWGKRRQPKVKLDGQQVPFKLKTLGFDTYVEIETNFLSHQLEVSG